MIIEFDHDGANCMPSSFCDIFCDYLLVNSKCGIIFELWFSEKYFNYV